MEKVADALDKLTGGLFEARLAETGSTMADGLRGIGEPDEEEETPPPADWPGPGPAE